MFHKTNKNNEWEVLLIYSVIFMIVESLKDFESHIYGAWLAIALKYNEKYFKRAEEVNWRENVWQV